MNHETIKEQLYAFYDGELDAIARQNLKTHLDGCLECREIYDRWSKTAKALFRKTKPETSEFFVQQVMNRVRELPSYKRSFGWEISLPWLVPALGLAMMIMVIAPSASQGGIMEEFVFSNNPASADESLQYVMEG